MAIAKTVLSDGVITSFINLKNDSRRKGVAVFGLSEQCKISKSLLRQRMLCSGLALAALGAASTVHAQAAAPVVDSAKPQELGEVVVTAQRRSISLQKTAASVAVLTADTLKSAGVQNISEAALLIPNFTFEHGNAPTQPNLSLRGIPTVQDGDPPVAFVVDGVQAPNLSFVNQDLLDIANVQVLLGPQGGIYGRDAVGGAVVIETQKPNDTFHDTLTVDAGNGDYFRATNTVSGPLIPGELWAKLTLDDHYFGGLIENLATGKPADYVKDYAGRLEILAKPTSTTTIDLVYSHTQGIDGANAFNSLPQNVIGQFSKYPVNYTDQEVATRHIDTFSAKVDQTTPIGTLTSVSQYGQTPTTFSGSADWAIPQIVGVTDPVTTKAFNEDLHLTSSSDQPIKWIVGGFYQLAQTVNNLNVFLVPPFGTATVDADDDHQNSAAWGVYGQASVPLPENLKLDVAMRYDSDTRSDTDVTTNPAFAAPVGQNGISHTFTAFEPAGTLSEQFTPDVMAYFTVGEGFRSGGFNAYADTLNAPLLVSREYPKETNLNYEVGVKSQFLDRRLTINADVFRDYVSNDQYFLFSDNPPARDVVTIKSVVIDGGEVAVTYLPIQGLTLNANLGVADSQITSNDLDQNDHGKHSPDANLYNAHLSALYRHHAWGDFDALYRVDYAYKGPVCFDSANQYCYHPVGFLNARVGLDNGRYAIALWAKNIFSVLEPIYFLQGATNYEIQNERATYGVELTARF